MLFRHSGKFFPVVVRAMLAAGALASTSSLSATPELPRHADQLQFAAPTIHLTRNQLDFLIARWLKLLDPEDTVSSMAAVDMLDGAPSEFVEGVWSKLRGGDLVDRIFEAAAQPDRDRLWNSIAISRNKLRDLLSQAYLDRLKSGLEKSDRIMLADLAAVGAGLRSLTQAIATELLKAVANQRVGAQIRGEFGALLLQKSSDLKPFLGILQDWRQRRVPEGVPPEELQKLARFALARMGEPLDDADITAILKEGTPEEQIPTLAFLLANPGRVRTQALAIEQLLRETRNTTVWSAAFDILTAADANLVDQIYSATDQATALASWPGEIVASFILRANAPQFEALRQWQVEPRPTQPPPPLDCPELRWKLALLQRMGVPDEQRMSTLWDLVSKRSACQSDISAAVDNAFATIGSVRLRELMIAILDRDGPGRLADMNLRLPSVSAALSADLYSRLDRHDVAGAERLLGIGVIPSAGELQRRRFWQQAFGPQPNRAIEEIDLHVMQAAGQVPDVIRSMAADFGKERATSVPAQNTALLALAATGDIAPYIATFLNALAHGNPAVSRPSLILLTMAYDHGGPPDKPKPPEVGVVENLLLQPDLTDDADRLLQTLVRYDGMFARAYADRQQWNHGVAAPCFALAQAPKIDVALAVSVLNAAATSAGEADRAKLLACVTLLVEPNNPVARFARAWDRVPASKLQDVFAAMRTLWDDESFSATANRELIGRVRLIVSAYDRELPFDLSSMNTLRYWKGALASTSPREADQVGAELTRRTLLAAAAGVPSVVVLHLLVWAALLAAYPRWPWVQAVVFWNPIVRKIIGFGYIDLILIHARPARRRLFSPFKAAFLGDVIAENVNQLDRISYFKESRVWHRAAMEGRLISGPGNDIPLLQALSHHRGRVLLLGNSGLGKSSFLRYSLSVRAKEDRDVIVYLRADQCRQGVETEVEQRMGDLGRDQNLLKAMIWAGRIFVYIDGYNEVELATQDLITGFLSRYPSANILVASQIPLRGLSTIETFGMVPLSDEQIRSFLASREPVLAPDALVRGSLFERIAISFLEEVASRASDDAERKAFDEILSNPMDLTSVAILLGDGRIPDLFALEAQQFEAVSRKLALTGSAFRTGAFSAAVFEQRLQDQENLQTLPFRPEVVALIAGKLAIVRTDSDDAGRFATQEVRFRHDRIRDFFTHFAFVAMEQAKREQFAEDARFAGVFPYLARALPSDEAEDLRERLIRRAAEIEDHRVSDSFVREYTWRQRLSARDPEWMLAYDLPQARSADSRLFEVAARRQEIDRDIHALRDVIAESRKRTRILTTADSNALQELAVDILIALGASAAPTQLGTPIRELLSPRGQVLRVVGLGQPDKIKAFHIEVMVSRFKDHMTSILVVTNAMVGVDPKDRDPDLEPQYEEMMQKAGGTVISARDLYRTFVDSRDHQVVAGFWSRLCGQQTGVKITEEAVP